MGLLNLMVANIELQIDLFKFFPSYKDMFDCFWTPYVLMLIVKESNQLPVKLQILQMEKLGRIGWNPLCTSKLKARLSFVYREFLTM